MDPPWVSEEQGKHISTSRDSPLNIRPYPEGKIDTRESTLGKQIYISLSGHCIIG